MSKKKTIVVLYNVDYTPEQGDYAARADVEKTAHAVAAAIAASDDYSSALVAATGRQLDFIERIQMLKPASVFNLCETLDAGAGNEVFVPALLDLLRIPYTGNGVLAVSTALRKDRTKRLLESLGISTPRAKTYTSVPKAKPEFGFPAILKPNAEDGSLGISSTSVVHDLAQFKRQAKELFRTYKQPVLCEQYVEGREIIVPLLEDGVGDFEALPWSEIDFSHMPKALPRIVTYAGKWEPSSDEYRGSTTRINPTVKPALKKKIADTARGAFVALECKGYARVDMRISQAGEPYVIDVNPNCDLSPHGGFFRSCKKAGMSYADMVMKLVTLSLRTRAR
ncbi:MAG: ATP-grasp domain-containing protein [Deltaproteobacteria bacterium]|nr:ATP-grasp domain-containing protein [Deltaproteobacteria bacterium]